MKSIILILLLFMCNCSKPKMNPIPEENFKIFFIGDSISSDDVGNISMTGDSQQKSFGWYLKQMLSDSIKYEFRNHAVSGVGISQMNTQMNTIITEKDTSKTNIVVILGAINNISFNGMTGEQCYTQISAIHNTLRGNGFKTICISLTSRRQLAYFTESQSQYFWTQIVPANNLFNLNKNSFCDKYLDLQADLLRTENSIQIGFGGYEAATESTYFLDGCHFADPGKIEIANKLKKYIITGN